MALNIGKIDCSTNQLNTGLYGCAVAMKQILFPILAKKGWSISKLDEFDQEYFDEQVQKGIFTILPQPVTFDDESEETVYETFDNGMKMFVRDGLAEYLPTFVGNLCLQKALQSLSGTRKDLLLVDIAGNVYGAETETAFKGFDLNLVQAERQTLPSGAETGKIPFRIQFSALGTNEWTKFANFISGADFNITSKMGVVDVLLETVSADTGEIKLKALVACDQTTPLEFFDEVSMWSVIQESDGTPATISAVTFANGVYTITHDGTGAISVKLYDSNLNTNVVEAEGMYFQSNELNITMA